MTPFPIYCRLIDLGRWIDGDYAIPVGSSASPDAEDNASGAERAKDDDEAESIDALPAQAVEACGEPATAHHRVWDPDGNNLPISTWWLFGAVLQSLPSSLFGASFQTP
jgi:endogenous inhibitor of DNA gyrase (YacG/DUF329 family)